LSNGFAATSDADGLQAICDRLQPGTIQVFFARWMARLPVPLTPADQATFYLFPGQSEDDIPKQVALFRVVTRDYFPTIGAHLREGRFFAASDRGSAPPAAIVNETFARRNFSGRTPLGERLKFGQLGEKGYWYTIVGVVERLREVGIAEEMRPAVYLLHEQTDQWETKGARPISIVVRTGGEPASIVPAIRQAIRSVDKNQPIWRVETLEEIVDRQLSTPRQTTALMSAFALLALLPAMLVMATLPRCGGEPNEPSACCCVSR
jgi:putative ABC transport system permease protein